MSDESAPRMVMINVYLRGLPLDQRVRCAVELDTLAMLLRDWASFNPADHRSVRKSYDTIVNAYTTATADHRAIPGKLMLRFDEIVCILQD